MLHADDTTVPVLLPGNGKTKTGRLWTYVRDDRNAGSVMAPAVWFAYSPDRKGVHPQTHLVGFSGVLQADAYKVQRAVLRRSYKRSGVLGARAAQNPRRSRTDAVRADR
jgi:transposase